MPPPALGPELRRLTQQALDASDPHRTGHIALGPGVVDSLPGWLDQAHPGASVLLVADEHTWSAAGETVRGQLESSGRQVEPLILEPLPGDDHLVCEDGAIEAVHGVVGARVAVAVGAGTINDIAKTASHQAGLPYVSVATAASMNGYTSSIAAILRRGVKRTIPLHQAQAVFADTDVIGAAPSFLTQAGFGDLVSKPMSHADWLLSHHLRDVPYDPAPVRVMDRAFDRLLDLADAVGRADPEGIAALTETILISGFSMALAGTSAPASGGEHLVSHYWDMEQHCRGLPLHALHGTQVGVATRISALLYERLLTMKAEDFERAAASAATRRPDASWLQTLGEHHPRLTEAVVAEVRDQLQVKQRFGDELAAELRRARDEWPTLAPILSESVLSAARLTSALEAAGCATRASQIGVSDDHLVATVRVCRHMRSRYVGLDLIDDAGWLHDWAADLPSA